MPKYRNNYSNPIQFDGTVFAPNQEVETYNTLDNRAFIVSSIAETYNIAAGVNDKLFIKFNDETAWTEVTLNVGIARTAAQIATDITAAYVGVAVATPEGGKIKITAPISSNVLNAVYIAATGTTADTVLGFNVSDVNPISCVSLQAFKVGTTQEPHNVTVSNNVFIFKVNNSNWITVTLTNGAAQTAADIARDINTAYTIATTSMDKVALAVTIDANVYIKLIAPVYNNFQSKLYIKSTLNTALGLLGFSGDNFNPIESALFPSLIQTAALPLYNPMISETELSFGAASTQHYYITDPDNCRTLQVIRVGGGAGIKFTIYLEDITNDPPFTVVELEALTFNLTKIRVTKIIITSNGIGQLTVRELKD